MHDSKQKSDICQWLHQVSERACKLEDQSAKEEHQTSPWKKCTSQWVALQITSLYRVQFREPEETWALYRMHIVEEARVQWVADV